MRSCSFKWHVFISCLILCLHVFNCWCCMFRWVWAQASSIMGSSRAGQDVPAPRTTSCWGERQSSASTAHTEGKVHLRARCRHSAQVSRNTHTHTHCILPIILSRGVAGSYSVSFYGVFVFCCLCDCNPCWKVMFSTTWNAYCSCEAEGR